MAASLGPYLDCLSGKRDSFDLAAEIKVNIGSRKHTIGIRLEQAGAETINLEVKHEDYWVRLERRPNQTGGAGGRRNDSLRRRPGNHQTGNLSGL